MRTELRKACEELESIDLLVRLGTASGFEAFMSAAFAEHSMGLLLEAAQRQEARLEIAQRALGLAARPIDVRYQNQWDTSLTLYLAALRSAGDEVLSRAVAEILLSSTPRLWWADRLATRIVSEERAAASSTSTAWVAKPELFSSVNLSSATLSLTGRSMTPIASLIAGTANSSFTFSGTFSAIAYESAFSVKNPAAA